MTDLLDPNVELHGTVGGLEEGKILRDLNQIRQAFETEDDEVWDEHWIEPQEFTDAATGWLFSNANTSAPRAGPRL